MEISPLQPTPVGALRFNTDSSKLEYYDGNQWVNVTSTSPEAQTGGTRGVGMGGWSGSGLVDIIEYVQINTTGNAVDFGNLANSEYEGAALGSRTRGIYWGGGPTPTSIQYITFASTGNAASFGTCTSMGQNNAVSDATRGISAGGWASPTAVNTIEYITIAQTGNAIDFGDLYQKFRQAQSFSSPTRGVFCGGSPVTNVIQYIEIQTTGNSADFGDLTLARQSGCGASNAVRGLSAGGTTPTESDVIDYITIASLGNAIDFGDLNLAHNFVTDGGASSPIRAIFMGGYANPGPASVDMIDYVQIMSTGNATDFGNLSANRNRVGACSNGHGGLG